MPRLVTPHYHPKYLPSAHHRTSTSLDFSDRSQWSFSGVGWEAQQDTDQAKALDKAKRQHLEGFNPLAVQEKVQELQQEGKELKNNLSPLYAELLMKYSQYKKQHHDRLFFENVYDTLIDNLDEAFKRLHVRPRIEEEFGLLFRSKHFNIYHRKNQPPRSVDTLSVKELYAIKHETTNRALNAKLLASLFEKPQSLGVQTASWCHSPLITQVVVSPITARSTIRDPKALMRSPQKPTAASTRALSMARLPSRRDFRTQSMVDQQVSKSENHDDARMRLQNSSFQSNPPEDLTTIAGLPMDENYTYLELLRRYLYSGPTITSPHHPSDNGNVPYSPASQTATTPSGAPMNHGFNSVTAKNVSWAR